MGCSKDNSPIYTMECQKYCFNNSIIYNNYEIIKENDNSTVLNCKCNQYIEVLK